MLPVAFGLKKRRRIELFPRQECGSWPGMARRGVAHAGQEADGAAGVLDEPRLEPVPHHVEVQRAARQVTRDGLVSRISPTEQNWDAEQFNQKTSAHACVNPPKWDS